MKKSIRFSTILLTVSAVFSMAGCGNINPPSPIDDNIYVSKVNANKNKNYLEVEGLPFNYNGIQIRTDWLMYEQGESISDMEYYFQVASSLGVKCVEIPLRWKDLEPVEDGYDFRNVSTFMSYAKKYDLKIEFLLFGVNITGMTGNAPSYVKNDKEKYPQYGNTLHHPDALFFVQDNPNTLGREKKCAEALMNAIYTWSKNNSYNAVIAIQARNEPDLFEDRRVEYKLTKADGSLLTQEEAYDESIYAIDEIGKVIKASKYKVITRVNVCCYTRHKELNKKWWNDLTAMESIDITGEDTYNPNIDFNKEVISEMNGIVKDKNAFSQIAENTGCYENNCSLLLMANMFGAGYNLYDMITPSVITDNWGYTDWGLLDNKTKQPKSTYARTKDLLNGINMAGMLFPVVSRKDIACFNLVSNNPQKEIAQTINTTKTTFNFETNSSALGYAINFNDYIFLFSDKDCVIEISNTEIDSSSLESGIMKNDGTFVSSNTENNITNNKISLKGNVLYRLNTTHTSVLVSDTFDNIHSEEVKP